ncbi:rRNA pseudouridine synthase [Arenimonas alkanexedens]
MTEPVRLSKRLAEIAGCSRSEAEQYVQGGWVRVDGVVIEEPQFKITDQTVALDPEARLEPAEPATFILHKPAGLSSAEAVALVTPANRWEGDSSGWRVHKRHFAHQAPAMPLEDEASGLLVLSQDGRVLRRLTEDAGKLEQEFIVDVEGELAPYGWNRLTHGTEFNGWPVAAFKVSWQSEQRLRFAIKAVRPGLLQHLCQQVGLTAVSMRRIRLGRVPLAKMPPGQWRYLPPSERF